MAVADHLTSILDALTSHLCVLDGHGVIVFANTAWREFADKNPPAPENYAIGENYLSVCDRATGENSSEAQPFAEGIRDVLRGNTSCFELEYPCHAPGTVRWFVGRVAPLPHGTDKWIVITHTDVTVHHFVDEALRESERRNRILLEAIPDLMFVVDSEGTFHDFHAPHDGLLAVPSDLLIGSRIDDMEAPQETRDLLRWTSQKAITTRSTQICRYTLRVPIGVRHFEARFVPLNHTSALAIARDITETQRIEQELRESEELYRETVSNISDAVFLTDEESRFVLVCSNVTAVLGYTVDEMYAMGSLRTVLGPTIPIPVDVSSELHDLEWSIVDKAGHSHDLLVHVKRVRIRNATRLYTCRDVTLSRKAEMEIRDAERRYRTLFENSGTGIVIIDRDGIYQMANKQGAAVMASRPEDVVGKSIRDFFPLDIANQYIEQNRDIIDSGIGKDYEASFPMGSLIRTFLITDRCIADEHGRGIALQSCSIEISDRKRIEEEFLASENRFRAIFEHSFIGLSLVTMDGKEIHNRTATAMLGYTQDEMRNYTWRDYTHPEDIPDIEQAIERLVHNDAPTFRIPQRLLHKNGGTIWAESSCALIRDKWGNPLYFVTAMLDMTELRTTQENLHALAGHLQSAREEERQYVAREIHDHFSQVLSALKIDLTLMMKDIQQHDESGLCIRIAQQLESFDASLETIIIELRHLVTGLRPEILETLGILAAMEFEIREFGRASGLPAQFTTNIGDMPIDMETSIALYRILQESLANIRQHALAHNVAVSFARTPDALVLQIEDDGRGFPTALPSHQIPYGILGMRERALLLKGEFSIQRTPAGKTIVTVRVPWPSVNKGGDP